MQQLMSEKTVSFCLLTPLTSLEDRKCTFIEINYYTLQLHGENCCNMYVRMCRVEQNAGENIHKVQQLHKPIRLLPVTCMCLHSVTMYAVNLHAQHVSRALCTVLLALVIKAPLALQCLSSNVHVCIHIGPVCLNACLTFSAGCPGTALQS